MKIWIFISLLKYVSTFVDLIPTHFTVAAKSLDLQVQIFDALMSFNQIWNADQRIKILLYHVSKSSSRQ